jgi:hypothetical protein
MFFLNFYLHFFLQYFNPASVSPQGAAKPPGPEGGENLASLEAEITLSAAVFTLRKARVSGGLAQKVTNDTVTYYRADRHSILKSMCCARVDSL